MMQYLLSSILTVLKPINLLLVFIGTGTGIMVGALPGFSIAMGVALFIPITFGMDTVGGLLLLAGVYTGGHFGGAISATLLATPGTPAAITTVYDGYPMAQRGEARRALNLSTISSVVGGLMGAITLMLLAPPLALFSLKFGPAEFFAVAIFGLTMISSLASDKSLVKSLIAGILGAIIGFIGMDPIKAFPRLTFGNMNLYEGVPLVPALIGLFSFSQVLTLVQASLSGEDKMKPTVNVNSNEKETFLQKIGWYEFKEVIFYWPVTLVSSAIGTLIGIMPGAGSTISSFLAYDNAKKMSKNKDLFGKGAPEGIIASETSNSAVTGGSLVPLLTLGIPGNSVSAIFLGGLLIQGLKPGADLFVNDGPIVYSFLVGLVMAQFAVLFLGIFTNKYFAKVLNVSYNTLVPIIFALCLMGSYALRNSMFDVYLMLGFGIIGFIMKTFDFSMTSMILGIILGPLAESNLRRVIEMTGSLKGAGLFIITKPIALFFILISFISLLWPLIKNRVLKLFSKESGFNK